MLTPRPNISSGSSTSLSAAPDAETTLTTVVIFLPPSRALRLVVPEARKTAAREGGSSPPGHRNGPGGASCRRHAGQHYAAFGPAPAAPRVSSRRLTVGVSPGLPRGGRLDGAADQQQAALGVDRVHREVRGGGTDATHPAGHTHTLEHAAWGGARANGAR